jgi:hypothetical protein
MLLSQKVSKNYIIILNNSNVLDNGEGGITSNSLKIHRSATAGTQSTLCSRMHQGMNADQLYVYTDSPS